MLGLTLEPRQGTPLDAEALRRLVDFTLEQLEKAEQSQLAADISPRMLEAYTGEEDASHAESLAQLLVDVRGHLREAKQWRLSDDIRVKLGELGIVLKDTPKGTVWKHK